MDYIILDSYTLECENLSLTFYAPNRSDKKMLSRQDAKHAKKVSSYLVLRTLAAFAPLREP